MAGQRAAEHSTRFPPTTKCKEVEWMRDDGAVSVAASYGVCVLSLPDQRDLSRGTLNQQGFNKVPWPRWGWSFNYAPLCDIIHHIRPVCDSGGNPGTRDETSG